ncbi:AMP-binding protein [Brevibacillus borstelensis]|uniref:AMP-binding protein n=1 Tax=Brevibacillus borstelensis TaxID=45462 RepID=UPI00203AD603|nr:AMP-binding protein [Brevibacillus borstelensis]MCM3590191.1 AMP-binding protein [Brevibacillus borstelensis]
MFWDIPANDDAILLIDSEKDRIFSFEAVQEKVGEAVHLLSSYSAKKSLGFLYCDNSPESIIAYLAALQKRDAVLLLNAGLNDELKKELTQTFQPNWVFSEGSFCKRNAAEQLEIHPDLAVLLSTSGTTGGSKLVRLSYENLQANAESIAQYLQIDQGERPITTLPMAYSYGLSVINSHLSKRASIVLTNQGVISKGFWDSFHKYLVTSFAGVPYTYKMLHRLRFDRMTLPSLRYFTQAGGRLPVDLVEYFLDTAEKNGQRFVVMYGQTEATARISYIPYESLANKKGTIGVPIPGGHLALDKENSELIYRGPNVMLGYAHSREDLKKGDELHGILRTGDLAEVDHDGFYTIIGRLKRFIKLFGLRVNLDDVEKMLEKSFSLPVACTGYDDRMVILIESEDDHCLSRKVIEKVQEMYKIHHSGLKVHFLPQFPVLPNGKIDYARLNVEVDA